MKASHAAAVLAFLVCILAAVNISAATLVVTKTEDTNDGVCDADCSMREAIAAAAADDTVVFSSLFNTPQTITLTLGQIDITRNLTITGTGRDLLTVSGNNASRIFYISGGASVGIGDMKLTNAHITFETFGGAIFVTDSSLILTRMVLTNNIALFMGPPGPDIGYGGAVYCRRGTLVVTDSVLTDNTAIFGAGIATIESVVTVTRSVVSNNLRGHGIYLEYADSIFVTDSTVSGNFWTGIGGSSTQQMTLLRTNVTDNHFGGVNSGGAILMVDESNISNNVSAVTLNRFGGGLITIGGQATVRNSTISGNRVTGDGGGIYNEGTLNVVNSTISNNRAWNCGGGIHNAFGTLYMTNSTVSGNVVDDGSGMGDHPGGGICDSLGQSRYLVLTNSTIANNRSTGVGGGIRHESGGNMILRNTIVAANLSPTGQVDVSGAVVSEGFNLVSNTTGSSGWLASDLINVIAMLTPLGDNGGPTFTHALLSGSPAIDGANVALAVDPVTNKPLLEDQRGFARVVGSSVDIGSFESELATAVYTIRGRAMSLTGRGIPRVRISLSDGTGTVYTQTNPFGYYRYFNVRAGTYTVVISDKSHTFNSPQTITVNSNLYDLNFIAK